MSTQSFKFVDQTAKVRQKFRYDESRPASEGSGRNAEHRSYGSEATKNQPDMEGAMYEVAFGRNSKSNPEERRLTSLRLLRVALGLEHKGSETPSTVPQDPSTVHCSEISIMFYGHCPYSIGNK
ncbi:uncharacterized protein PAC_11527 [Phialocephala subalpina]|uniref:Uncharacterized protein n=1 Tax=Phialocephala subalpina TaxID=576137 RepID=A0A1L7X9D5_9HELO|nr:uncharacterized protein PAC_11527 [Phialocephala subalpina]